MTKDQNRRLNPKDLKDDQDTLSAITTMTPPYTPSNITFSLPALQSAQTSMLDAQSAEVHAEGVAAGARDTANKQEWAFHNAILGAKDQVTAQYGADSDQVQAIGLKKKSEYKKPSSGQSTKKT